MTFDEQMMHRCLQLAELGRGNVAPNPMVGAVIVYEGKIIGEGYHECFGEAHAEVNAINSVIDHQLLSESTIYVSLEPCAHFGKTPPCANLLVDKKFKRVVVGTLDIHSKVYKKGIQRLEAAGIDVEVGVCKAECQELNHAFFTFHEKKRPFVLLKWAQTPAGFIDNSGGKDGEVSWISAPETQVKVHKWRSETQAILVGKNTVLNDNPSLTVRAVGGKNPMRIVLDSNNEVSPEAAIFNEESETIVFNLEIDSQRNNVQFIQLKALDPQSILSKLFELSVQSVLIEGGRTVLQSFIYAELWDEARIISGRNEFNSGTLAPQLRGKKIDEEIFYGDHISYLRPL